MEPAPNPSDRVAENKEKLSLAIISFLWAGLGVVATKWAVSTLIPENALIQCGAVLGIAVSVSIGWVVSIAHVYNRFHQNRANIKVGE